MRKIIIMAAMAVLCMQTADAQNWQDLLRRLTGGSSKQASTEQTAEEQAPALTAATLCSTWTYSAPAMKYEGDDMLASIALKGVESYLPALYAKVGLTSGTGKATFTTLHDVHAEAGDHKASGSYTFDPSTGDIVITAGRGDATASFHGTATLENGVLVLLFDAAEAADIMEKMSESAAKNEQFKTMKSLLDSYPGIKLGCKMTR